MIDFLGEIWVTVLKRGTEPHFNNFKRYAIHISQISHDQIDSYTSRGPKPSIFYYQYLSLKLLFKIDFSLLVLVTLFSL